MKLDKYKHNGAYFKYNPLARETIIKRAKTLKFIRKELDDKGFIEVETPILRTK